MPKVLIVSDDHCFSRCFGTKLPNGKVIWAQPTGKLTEWIKNEVQPDFVVHAGDFENKAEWINQIANWWVIGNQDVIDGPKDIKFKIGGRSFYLTHGVGDYCFKNGRWAVNRGQICERIGASPDFIIMGHNHIQEVDNLLRPVFINPGSLNFPRDRVEWQHQFAVLIFDEKEYTIELWGFKKGWTPAEGWATKDYDEMVKCQRINGVF
ncbi:MAG: YfcE family phosphodiesterase [Mycoplasmataceae bacterium]|jgi:putative phosphoesterase|nr:YfcE family phosphodiesterase [Mycoplasmataceae bacterium]